MKRIRAGWGLLIGVCLVAGLCGSARGEMDGFKEISAPEVKNLIEERKAVVVNLLSHLEYETQHIPGSISIPIIDIETTDRLPKDKDTPVVFYCMGKR
jgi:rhodanese-related sulfurtransferase